MAIQFQCAACDQPIEVDDEWASRSVTCPFCHTTVTAPQASTFVPAAGAPVASPAGPYVAAVFQHAVPQITGNALAVWATLLAGGALVLYFVSTMFFLEWLRELAGPGASPEEAQRIMMEQVQVGATPPWLMTACLLLFAVFGLWAAAVGCGIAALRKPARRAWAIVALVLSGVLPLLLCIGVASGLSGGLGG